MRSLDFMVRDLNHHKLFGQAIQAMLRDAGIQSNLRTVVESVWFGDATAGNYDLAVGAIVSTLLDPSDYFNPWYRTDGPQNYSFWHNAEFDKLVGTGRLGEYPGCLVKLREGSQSERLFRHLRRGSVRHVLAG